MIIQISLFICQCRLINPGLKQTIGTANKSNLELFAERTFHYLPVASNVFVLSDDFSIYIIVELLFRTYVSFSEPCESSFWVGFI